MITKPKSRRRLHSVPATAAAFALALGLALGLTVAVVPGAIAATSDSLLQVTAQVTDYCNVDSTAMDLISVNCSLDTPLVVSPADAVPGPSALAPGSSAATGNSAAGNPTGGSFIPASLSETRTNTLTPALASKLCNFLASEELENASFNQYSLDITRRSVGAPDYYSTYEVCF